MVDIIRSLDCNLEIMGRSDNDEALTRLFGESEESAVIRRGGLLASG